MDGHLTDDELGELRSVIVRTRPYRSSATFSPALRRLVERGLVAVNGYGYPSLTYAGRQALDDREREIGA